MLPDDIPYRTRKPKLLRKIDPVPHVGFHRQLGEVWGKFVMRVLHVNLILNEVVRTLCLADIMVIGTHSGQEWIRTNRLGCSFSQIAHQYAVVIRTRSYLHQSAEQRLRRVGQLQQPQWCGQVKCRFKHHQQPHRQHHTQKTVADPQGLDCKAWVSGACRSNSDEKTAPPPINMIRPPADSSSERCERCETRYKEIAPTRIPTRVKLKLKLVMRPTFRELIATRTKPTRVPTMIVASMPKAAIGMR